MVHGKWVHITLYGTVMVNGSILYCMVLSWQMGPYYIVWDCHGKRVHITLYGTVMVKGSILHCMGLSW